MKLRQWFGTLAVFVMAGLALHAGNGVQAAAGAGYSVSPQIPDNQRSAVSNYFDLVVKPGTTQNLTLAITNRTAQVRQLTVSVTTAWSQSNGQVSYAPGGPKDPSAQYRLSELAPRRTNVTLKPNAIQNVTVPVKIPTDGFKGVLLGALYVMDKAKSGGEQSGGLAIKNRFATVVAVQLQTSVGAINRVKPHLNLMKVGAGVHDNQASVLATLQNDRPRYWGKMNINGKVYKRGTKTVVMRREAGNYAVAPNSHFDFALTNKKALDPGDYTLDVLVTGPHGRWHFKRNFSILVGDATRINKKLGLKRDFIMPWWGWLLIGAAVVLIIWLLWWLIRRRKRSAEEK